MSNQKELNFPPTRDWYVWVHFMKAYKAVTGRVDGALRKDSNLTLAEFEILLLVKRARGRIRFIDLSKVTLLSQSRISRQVDSLKVKGYLLREITDTDRRATFAVMTPAGETAYEEAVQPFLRAYYTEFVDLIPKADEAAFQRVQEALLKESDFRGFTNSIMEAARQANDRDGS